MQFSKDDKEEEKEPPKGFEKFFRKRNERKSSSSKEESSQEESKDDQEEKKAEESEETKDDEDADSENDSDKKKKKKGGESFGERMRNIYFGSNGNPKPEAWMTLLAALACGYAAMTYETPRKEIVFMTFLNDYLLKNQIKEIKIAKDPRSEVFNHRAEIDTVDGQRLYMVLGSQESFLAKLDQIQRQMGKQPAEFIPVKYVNDQE